MKARAPGKLIFSGAYAVLRGAPALVTAVDRFAYADTSRRPEFVTPEVEAALSVWGTQKQATSSRTSPEPPWFDAAELRDERGKIGLGSSAAILVASLGALALEEGSPPDELAEAVFPVALRAHRRAQGGGSGVDVASASFGGTLRATPREQDLQLESVALPPDLVLEAWALGHPASTPALVRTVFALELRDPAGFERLLDEQFSASVRAAQAIDRGDSAALIEALSQQLDALDALGLASGAPIVVDPVRRLGQRAMPGTVFLPSGAGGGDVSLFVGSSPSSEEFRQEAETLGLFQLPLRFGVPGVGPA